MSTTNCQDDLQCLLHRVEYMRERQKAYASSRMDTNKASAKKAEQMVDDACIKLRRQGYQPQAPIIPAAQPTLL